MAMVQWIFVLLALLAGHIRADDEPMKGCVSLTAASDFSSPLHGVCYSISNSFTCRSGPIQFQTSATLYISGGVTLTNCYLLAGNSGNVALSVEPTSKDAVLSLAGVSVQHQTRWKVQPA